MTISEQVTSHPGVADPRRVTRLVADYMAGAGQVSDATAEVVMKCVLDTAAVTVAALSAPEGEPLVRLARREAASGRSTSIVLGPGVSAASAALADASLGHVLDYDDVSHQIKGHPSVVMVPALLAVAEERGLAGRRVLDAYAVGFEAGCAVARGVGLADHYNRGWHATSTVGTVGATAAVARLIRLDATQTRHALGVAASLAAGSRQNFGSTTKSLHAGRASQAAVLAAEFAEDGGSADPDQLEGPLGFFALFGSAGLRDGVVPLGRDLLLGPDGVNLKRYPCCYHGLRAAEAAAELHRRLPSTEVASVDVVVEPGGSASLLHAEPGTGLEAKFSGPYIVATALRAGSLSLGDFTDEAVRARGRDPLLSRITVREGYVPPAGPLHWERGYAVVIARTASGTQVSARVDDPLGSAARPVDQAGLEEKVRDCLDRGGRQRAEHLMRAVRDLPTALPAWVNRALDED